jgi:hypothetical protein
MPRPVGEWTKDKLKLLELYLPGYLQATTRTLDRIYIDGFAGPGRNLVRDTGEVIAGSPLIALDAHANGNASRFTRLYFIEKDAATANELRSVLAARAQSSGREDPRVTVIEGDVNIELPRIVRSLNKAEWRTELFINFPLGMAINRNPSSQKVDAYFGTSEWKPLQDRHDTRGILDLYKGRLAGLGYDQQAQHDPLIRTSKGFGQHLYYMIPASKVPAALNIWNWVVRQPDASGQTKMF